MPRQRVGVEAQAGRDEQAAQAAARPAGGASRRLDVAAEALEALGGEDVPRLRVNRLHVSSFLM